jgi:hypothetical protein
VKILSVTLFRKLIGAFWYRHMATCDSEKLIKKTRDLNILPEAGLESTLEKIDQWEGRKFGTEFLMVLSDQSLKWISIFKEASRRFTFKFLFNKEG